MKKFLVSLIQSSEQGYIGYDQFIQEALYHPKLGYYHRNHDIFGKRGDFYTSTYVHPVFSRTILNVFIQLVRSVKLPINVCELGAGEGMFAEQVIKELEMKNASYQYFYIETSESLKEKFKHRLSPDKRKHVHFFSSLDECLSVIGPFNGFIFSNEFLDAQPVKVIEKRNGQIQEVVISIDKQSELKERLVACPDPVLKWMDGYSVYLKEGQRIEVPVYIFPIMEKLHRILDKGVVLTIDYGYTGEEWKHPARKKGSLRGYDQHRMVEDLLRKPGEVDITHHVHWDTWIKAGEEQGMEFVGLFKQNEFLLQGGILNELEEDTSPDYFSEKHRKNRAIRSLIQGEGFAGMFDVCVQATGVDSDPIRGVLTKKPGFM